MASVFKRGGKKARGYYYTSWFDHSGRRRTKCTRTTDKATAERIARKYEDDAAKRREGLIDPSDDRFAAEGRRRLADHLDDFLTSLLARENTPQHCRETVSMARKLAEHCGAEYPSELSASAVEQAIKFLRDGGASLRTCNAYLRAIKSFSRWLQRDKRIRDDDLAILQAYNAETDKRHVRRELAADELSYLIAATETNNRHEFCLPAADRAMLYRLAVGTGFRAGELRSLTPAAFDLDADPPTVTILAKSSKRRRTDVQPIRRDLADLLRTSLADKNDGAPVFGSLPGNAARMLRADLAFASKAWIDEAEIDADRLEREKSDFLAYRNAAGAVFDFHALRHQFVSAIVANGASVKTAQELARHSTPALTIGRYSHTRLHDLRGGARRSTRESRQ